jgi:hypothetical protein
MVDRVDGINSDILGFIVGCCGETEDALELVLASKY